MKPPSRGWIGTPGDEPAIRAVLEAAFPFSAKAAAGFASSHAGLHLMAVAPGCGDLPARCGEMAHPPAFAAPG